MNSEWMVPAWMDRYLSVILADDRDDIEVQTRVVERIMSVHSPDKCAHCGNEMDQYDQEVRLRVKLLTELQAAGELSSGMKRLIPGARAPRNPRKAYRQIKNR